MSFTDIIRPVLETDSRLVSSPEYFASVKSTPQSIAQNVYPSNSQSNANSHLWNIQTPSTDVMINRNFIVEADISLRLTFPNATIGATTNALARFNQFHGRNNGLCAFPFNRLCNTQTLTMNSFNTTVNSNDCLSELIHMYDEDDLIAMSGTANCPDYLALYNGIRTLLSDSNPALPLQYTHTGPLDNGNIPNILGNYFNSSIKSKLKGNSTNVEVVSATLVNDTNVDVVFRVRENFIGLSPLTSGAEASSHLRGMMGITNLQLTVVFNGNANRLYRSARYQQNALGSVGECSSSTLNSVSNAKLLITYYSLKPSQLPNPRNVIPYYQVNTFYSNETGAVAGGADRTLQAPNLQLSVIPDLVVFSVEPLNYTQTETTTQQNSKWAGDWVATINNVSIQFNNQNGILSNAQKIDLWNMSRCSFPNQEWHDFNGKMPYVDYDQILNAGVVQSYGAMTFRRGEWPSAHCHLALRFGEDIPIPQEYLSVGSLGSFNFSAQVNFTNQITNGNDPNLRPWYDVGANFRLKVMIISLGAISNELGTTGVTTGFFTKQMVMSVIGSETHGVSSRQLKSFIGKGKMDMEGEGIFDWVIDNTISRVPVVGGLVGSVAKKLNPFGAGTSGGGISGGAQHVLDKYRL